MTGDDTAVKTLNATDTVRVFSKIRKSLTDSISQLDNTPFLKNIPKPRVRLENEAKVGR